MEASRAYDKMILWVDLHSANPGSKTGITNFDKSEYEPEMAYLQSVSQVTYTQRPHHCNTCVVGIPGLCALC